MQDYRYNPLSNCYNQDPPQDDPNGLWGCVTDREDSDDTFFPILEVHESSTWDRWHQTPENRKVIFRISRYINGEIRIGECVILGREEAQQIHDHLGRLLDQMK